MRLTKDGGEARNLMLAAGTSSARDRNGDGIVTLATGPSSTRHITPHILTSVKKINDNHMLLVLVKMNLFTGAGEDDIF